MLPIYCDHPHVGTFRIREVLEKDTVNDLFLVFSASLYAEKVQLPKGQWEIYINGEQAGTTPLGTVSDVLEGPPICAMVLIRKEK